MDMKLPIASTQKKWGNDISGNGYGFRYSHLAVKTVLWKVWTFWVFLESNADYKREYTHAYVQ